MRLKTSILETKRFSKAAWWVLVALYTFILPEFYSIYRNIVTFFSQDAAGKVPVLMVAVLGIAYVVAILVSQKSPKNLLFLVPCGVIAILIMTLESNPNKHIHIPEYVLMTWLLYAALAKDHKGNGVFFSDFHPCLPAGCCGRTGTRHSSIPLLRSKRYAGQLRFRIDRSFYHYGVRKSEGSRLVLDCSINEI